MINGTCNMTFLLPDGIKVDYQHKFTGCSIDSIGYNFLQGNYACDCNRSMFIQSVMPDFPEMDCGEKISITKFSVELANE